MTAWLSFPEGFPCVLHRQRLFFKRLGFVRVITLSPRWVYLASASKTSIKSRLLCECTYSAEPQQPWHGDSVCWQGPMVGLVLAAG